MNWWIFGKDAEKEPIKEDKTENIKDDTCKNCNGTGSITFKCEVCNGTGHADDEEDGEEVVNLNINLNENEM